MQRQEGDKFVAEINRSMNDYRERFNKMYELGYDSSWLDEEIPQEIRDYIQRLISGRSLDVRKSRVMDLGCGRGRLLRYLEQEGFIQTVGIDVSEVACRLAKQQVERSEILVADVIRGLPFRSRTFSLVTELTLMSSLNPQCWPTILNEIHKILDRGGFYISEVFTRDRGCDINQPLVTRSVIPRELDQVYGVTRSELVNIFGRQFSIKECLPVNLGLNGNLFILAQRL